jgi:hypothetical protein
VKKIIILLALYLFSQMGIGQETQVKLYRPFSPSPYQATLSANQTTKGVCWEQSHVDKREGAWRCKVGTSILDPCFVKSFGDKKQALCPQSPWSGQAVKVLVEHDLKDVSFVKLDMSKNYPWAMELTNGTKCQKIADANQQFDGLPIHYLCDDNTILFGRIQRCKEPWSVLQKSHEDVLSVEIQRVWF